MLRRSVIFNGKTQSYRWAYGLEAPERVIQIIDELADDNRGGRPRRAAPTLLLSGRVQRSCVINYNCRRGPSWPPVRRRQSR